MLDTMATIKKRLAGAVLLTMLSIISIIILLPNSRVSTHLQKITLGTTIDNYADLWKWGQDDELKDGEKEDVGGGIRIVVFGDSWVDDLVAKKQKGKGKGWPQVLCEEVCLPNVSRRLIDGLFY